MITFSNHKNHVSLNQRDSQWGSGGKAFPVENRQKYCCYSITTPMRQSKKHWVYEPNACDVALVNLQAPTTKRILVMLLMPPRFRCVCKRKPRVNNSADSVVLHAHSFWSYVLHLFTCARLPLQEKSVWISSSDLDFDAPNINSFHQWKLSAAVKGNIWIYL